MKRCLRYACALLGLTLTLTPVGVASASHSATVHTVQPGESIQAALDRARPGDTVLVRPGTYRENLEISTDRVTLLGYGATLAAPDTPTQRRCSLATGADQNPFGLCITGDFDPAQPATVRRPVRDVTVRGLTVAQFPFTGIRAFGADGTRIEAADVAGGTSYGILFTHSSDSLITASRVHGGRSAGIYIGDSLDARATVVGTEVFDNGLFGIFVRDAAHGTFVGNVVHDNCVGMGFLPTRPDREVVTDWRVTANHIRDNNRFCPLATDPPLTALGVLIGGASAITVTHNAITGNAPLADAPPTRGGGVVLTTGVFGGPPHPADNRIQGNLLHGNQPDDLAVLDEGTGNRVSGNACRTSTPDGLCAR